jgi:hypothetical protein
VTRARREAAHAEQRPERQSSVPQQPREVVQLAPAPRQQRLVVGVGAQE